MKSFLNVRDGAKDILKSRLVDNGLQMANDVGELCAERGIDGEGGKAVDNRSKSNIGKSDAFCYEVCSC